MDSHPQASGSGPALGYDKQKFDRVDYEPNPKTVCARLSVFALRHIWELRPRRPRR